MIITPKRPRNSAANSRISQLVPYMLKGQGGERCTWYMAGNLEGLDRREDADLALSVMELIQEGNVRTKRDKTYHVVISFHPNDRKLTDRELEDVVRRTVAAVGLQEHQYIAVRHSDQEHEHVHIAVNKIHPVTLKVHHPFRDIPPFRLLAGELEKELGLYQVDRSVRQIDSDRSRDYESASGVQSFSRWARSHIGERIDLDGISNWNELHARLTVHGVRMVRRGNGLAVVDATQGDLACKASTLGRHWSKQRLCERFGDFVSGPTAEHVATVSRETYRPEPLGPLRDDGLWREYQDALSTTRARRDEQRQALSSKVDTARAAHRRHFKLRHHAIAAMPIPGREKHKTVQDAFVRENGCRAQDSGRLSRDGGPSASTHTRGLGRSSWQPALHTETSGPSDDSPANPGGWSSRAATSRFAPSHLAVRGRVVGASSTTCQEAYGSESRPDRSSSSARPVITRSSSW